MASEIIYQAPASIWPERNIVVESLGDGRAIMLVVEGNYPIDYFIHDEKAFETADEACETAEKMACG